MKLNHFLAIPFTGLGLKSGFRGNIWLKNRIDIFKQFVLPALINQKNRDFTLVLNWRPEEEGNPLVMNLESTLKSIRDFKFLNTYHGILFIDDKYDEPVASDRLRNSLKMTLPELNPLLGDSDTVLLTTQPSDDIYLSHAVSDIQARVKGIGFPYKPYSVGYREGYIMNYRTLELAEYARSGWKTDETSTYLTNTIPPFFTVVFPRSVFLDPEAHMKWTGPYRSHEYIAAHTKYYDLKNFGFIVGTHGENISTTWTHRYKGKMVEGEAKEKVMLQAGLFGAEPLKLKVDKPREIENKFVSYLPKSLKRAWVRLRSPGIGSAIDSYNWFRL